ncbi:MAG: ankyrin repeat domain-containing protein [Hyphomicrobiales bacterium]|nr:ankyrin repeat domain-containing protein [Hyphomicrobiales bacterium]
MNDDDDAPDPEALHYAAGDGDLPRVKALIAEGYSVNAFDELGWTPLHHAAQKERLEVVRFLIAAGADVNARDEAMLGDSVLKDVAQTCSLELATILLKGGADPTLAGGMGVTALHRSADRKRFEGPPVHELLLEAARQRNPAWPGLDEFALTRNERNKKLRKREQRKKVRKRKRRG